MFPVAGELDVSRRHNASTECKAPVMKLVQHARWCLGSRLAPGRRYETVQTARRHNPDHKISEPGPGAASVLHRYRWIPLMVDLFPATDFSAVDPLGFKT